MTMKAATTVVLTALLLVGQGVAAARSGPASGPACTQCRCVHCDPACCAPGPSQPLPQVPAAPTPDSIRDFLQVAGQPPALLLYAMEAPRVLESRSSSLPPLQAATVPLFQWDCTLLI